MFKNVFQVFFSFFFVFGVFSFKALTDSLPLKNFSIKGKKVKLTSDFPLAYNSQVKKWIHYFEQRGRDKMEKWLKRSPLFVPSIRRTFHKKGLPKDLAYLSFIESGLSAHAISSARAVGYWQFMPLTARDYGLKTNWWLDERKDFIKSTYAAASYLKKLYRLFRSWNLAISAYNMGENRLMKLIKQHKTKNFWTLSQKKDFPRETKEYIPKLLATLFIVKHPHVFDFKTKESKKDFPHEMNYEYLLAPGGTDLYLLALHMNIPVSKIKNLNPEIHLGFIPLHIKEHMIRIPKKSRQKVTSYIQMQFKKQMKFQLSQTRL